MTTPRVALLAGSIRSGSMNRKLAAVIAATLAEHDLDAEIIDLVDYPMPIYDGDDEAEHGQPASAMALHDRLAGFDGLIMVTPEYNGGPSALLKNSIDWVTRVDRSVFKGLLIGLATATPGARGGRAGLGVMRSIADHMRLDIVDDDLSIGEYGGAFEDIGGRIKLVRSHDIEAADRFAGAYAKRLRERSLSDAAGR